MTTISVPVTEQMLEFINQQIKMGFADNKASVIRRAISRLREEEAIQEILRAEREPDLHGDLRELAKKFKNHG
ncbi:MAG: hypothetical protein A3C79_02550 [Candidatus Taylorbacteria bacterium RIFCSPHIGHO2_02_FULL_45_28]|uniref:CopG family transcriptional regulator n=1 Tax=Candidatus Taylorbacteria bacterium RIFCSPHIGHO2_12_FULL_45_16 TaxID=1802315 RepID=A0A1G2MXR5_9BACT|nr:MAG: hypothetical protein A2830_03355 [Candidatus Taylorbacteria bacterium RIFCSPHIGHO2_01_FULL_44_110]OHA25329.1 MAG: hypothetical protein A3C79_02550 [Candidatus Taylorbacteria bacterium RIFCSPHIGHO2_02_FULL_45_28]OHA28716.1 MAG: hypothetical protein A3F51_03015 [Candidatus Taylorbacteria bacterium RIFCSPHIGHO2_12_FULL_45_16]OHA32990.1 MAG: hypothetical protein A3A23_01195 [Candidatus Taylorbacteria bacterium RIFCSPLOWO2_01_FULL_45_59]OHA38479.1 MAG: hypothetical protein A3I98_00705 [Candi